MADIKGVDISYCQKGLDYTKLKEAGVKFAIIRAAYGESKDTQLDNHVAGCKKVGVDVGFYVYSLARTVEEAKKEAKACAEIMSKYDAPTYPVFFDLEDNDIANEVSRDVHTDCAIAFCEELKKVGYYSGIYANPAWLENYYDKARLVGKYDIWLAHWTESPDKPSRYDYEHTMWQWGVDNIGMKIDGDICYINYPEKIKAWTAENFKVEDNNAEKEATATKAENAATKAEDKADSKEAASGSAKKYEAGDKVVLNKTPLYAASSLIKPANYLSGEYFILSPSIINGKIRITTPKGNTVCTGWVAISDLNSEDKCNLTQTVKEEQDKALTEIAKRVIRGEFGCGQTRVMLLTKAGYDYTKVQQRVNELLSK